MSMKAALHSYRREASQARAKARAAAANNNDAAPAKRSPSSSSSLPSLSSPQIDEDELAAELEKLERAIDEDDNNDEKKRDNGRVGADSDNWRSHRDTTNGSSSHRGRGGMGMGMSSRGRGGHVTNGPMSSSARDGVKSVKMALAARRHGHDHDDNDIEIDNDDMDDNKIMDLSHDGEGDDDGTADVWAAADAAAAAAVAAKRKASSKATSAPPAAAAAVTTATKNGILPTASDEEITEQLRKQHSGIFDEAKAMGFPDHEIIEALAFVGESSNASERVTEYLLSSDDKKAAIRQAEIDKQLRQLDQQHHQEMRRVQTEATIAKRETTERAYQSFLRALTMNGSMTDERLQRMDKVTREAGVTKSQHDKMALAVGITPEILEDMKKTASLVLSKLSILSECALCHAPKPDHIVLDCMHLCLCEKCASGLGKRAPCPRCQRKSSMIRRVYHH